MVLAVGQAKIVVRLCYPASMTSQGNALGLGSSRKRQLAAQRSY